VSILKAWGKKQAVALHEGFFSTLPPLPTTDPPNADIAWLIYGLELDAASQRYHLTRRRTEHTAFQTALDRVTVPVIGSMETFMNLLQGKLDEKLGEGHSPDAPALGEILSE
jgi:hypothetical protein